MKRGLFLLLAWFVFSAGGAIVVEKVSFTANFPIDSDELVKAGNLHSGAEYDPAAVNASIAALQAWLQENGHPWVRIPFPELIPLSADKMELAFHLEEILSGERLALRFSGLRYFSEAKLRDLLLLGEQATVPISELPGLLQQILDLYQRRGYLFIAAQVDSLSLDKELTAFIGVSEGKPLHLEKYYFQGNKYTREQTLVKLAGLGQNAIITPDLLSAAEENILRKSYILSCQVEPVDPSSVLIKVEEGKMTYLEGVLGFTRRNGKTELTGSLGLQFLNLWGSDRSVGLNWRRTTFNNLLELAYHESGPANFPLAGDLALGRISQDSTWVKSSANADVYSYNAHQKYGLALALQSIVPGTRRPIIVEKSAIRSIGAFWRFDNRDQQLAPARGMQTNIAYRFRNSATGKRWSNALEADHTQYLGLSRRWTAALGLHLRSLGVRDTTDYVLYRMGGFNSLRGYHEDEFSSWRLAWTSLELRYLITAQSRIYLFYDQGFLTQPDDSIRYNLLAPGMGLKVRTRLGVLSIEYALGYRENGFADLGAGMVHVGLDTSF